MGDRGDDAPGDEVAGEVVDNGQQVVPHSRDVQEGPVLSPDLIGLIGFVMGSFPGRFPEALGDHPPFRFENSIAAGWTDPDAFVPQMPTDLSGTHLGLGLLLL